jgi:putative transposase
MNKALKLSSGNSCVFKMFFHVVFVTKYRRSVLDGDMLSRLKELFGETMQQLDGSLIEFGGEADHVHLMINTHPKHSLSNIVKKLKGRSYFYLRKEFWVKIREKLWGNHFWSSSYCVISCGGAPLSIIKEYISNQQGTKNFNNRKSRL